MRKETDRNHTDNIVYINEIINIQRKCINIEIENVKIQQYIIESLKREILLLQEIVEYQKGKLSVQEKFKDRVPLFVAHFNKKFISITPKIQRLKLKPTIP